MSDFEELLNEVVGHEANIQPPAGMESRIASALSSESRDRAEERVLRYSAAAAAILIAVTGVLVGRHLLDGTSAPLAVTLPARVSAIGTTSVPIAMKKAPQGAIRVGATRAAPRYREAMQLETAHVQPLQIKRLVVPPLEIASLVSGHIDSTGETR